MNEVNMSLCSNCGRIMDVCLSQHLPCTYGLQRERISADQRSMFRFLTVRITENHTDTKEA